MKREFELNCIQGISSENLLYEDNGKIKKIDIKSSAEFWWEKHHKTSLWDVLLRRKTKNKYAGSKCFNFTEPYIKLYADEDEFIFKKYLPEDLDTSDACELRMWWDKINTDINQLGYWLFDEG